jgi:hypothetical protein
MSEQRAPPATNGSPRRIGAAGQSSPLAVTGLRAGAEALFASSASISSIERFLVSSPIKKKTMPPSSYHDAR